MATTATPVTTAGATASGGSIPALTYKAKIKLALSASTPPTDTQMQTVIENALIAAGIAFTSVKVK